MSGTVDSHTSVRNIFMLYLLWFLVLCLAIHFVAEDTVLFSDTISGMFTHESYDELTHQDDLVMAVNLPDHVPGRDIIEVFFALVILQNQTVSPILQPPRI